MALCLSGGGWRHYVIQSDNFGDEIVLSIVGVVGALTHRLGVVFRGWEPPPLIGVGTGFEVGTFRSHVNLRGEKGLAKLQNFGLIRVIAKMPRILTAFSPCYLYNHFTNLCPIDDTRQKKFYSNCELESLTSRFWIDRRNCYNPISFESYLRFSLVVAGAISLKIGPQLQLQCDRSRKRDQLQLLFRFLFPSGFALAWLIYGICPVLSGFGI